MPNPTAPRHLVFCSGSFGCFLVTEWTPIPDPPDPEKFRAIDPPVIRLNGQYYQRVGKGASLSDPEQALRLAQDMELFAPQPYVASSTLFERTGDMSPDDALRLIVQEDGDIIVSVRGTTLSDEPVMASVEFCTPMSGGGRSPIVRRALRELILAIQSENQSNPIP